jgi:hypothetical protein
MDGEKVEGAIVPTVTPLEQMAIDVYQFFGGDVQWAAMPWVAEMFGCDDLDALCALVGHVRNHRAQAMRD